MNLAEASIYAHHDGALGKKKGGFFGWLRRTVANVAGALEGIVPFAGIVQNIFMDDGWIWRPTSTDWDWGGSEASDSDVELTAEDEAILDNWVDNIFWPRYEQMLNALRKHTFLPPTVAVFNTYYDQVQQYLAAMRWYVQYLEQNGMDGLTDNAAGELIKFIEHQLNVIEDQLSKYFNSTNVAVQSSSQYVNIKKSDYPELVGAPTTIRVSQKKVANSGTVTGGPIKLETTVELNPDIKTTDIKNIKDVPDVPDIKTVQAAQTSETPQGASDDKSKNYLWVLAAIAAAVIYKITKKDKK